LEKELDEVLYVCTLCLCVCVSVCLCMCVCAYIYLGIPAFREREFDQVPYVSIGRVDCCMDCTLT